MSLLHVLEVVVASTDVPASVVFHCEAFGWEVLDGAVDSAEGVTLGVPGAKTGRLRLVATSAGSEWEQPPAVWDFGARLLGIYSRDLEATVARIHRSGGSARKPITYPYGTASLSEVIARGVDGVWWTVPLAVSGGHRPSPALEHDADRLHSELHTAVLVVDDHDAAVSFFEAGGMKPLFDGSMSGPDFEELVGMPEGAELRLAFLVGPDQAPARLEIMSFTGVPAVDRSSEPVGIQRLVFATDDVDAARQALLGAGATELEDGALRGPGGVEIALVLARVSR